MPDNFIDIDLNKLDEEWLIQPRLRLAYGEKLADAKFELDQAEANLDVTQAEVEKRIRTSPEGYGVKSREASIKGAVTTHRRVVKCVSLVNQAKHRVNMIQAAVNALDHRKKSLEDLVQLHLSGYFSEPKAPKAHREEVDKMAKKKLRSKGRTESG